MKSMKLLRIASLLALVQYSVHALLFLSIKPVHGDDETALVEAMKTLRWTSGVSMRSYWDFYFGYGILAIFWGVIEVVLLWQLSTIAKTNSHAARPVVGLFIMANLVHAVLVWEYFSLLVPIFFDIGIAFCLVLAFVSSERGETIKIEKREMVKKQLP